MKKFNIFYLFATLFVAFMLILASCTKEGPAGPAGQDGADGQDGVDGVDGQDGTAGCIQCHDNDAQLVTVSFQWERSMHNAGSALSRSSNGSCSPCHSGQGFALSNGNELDAGVPVNDPTTINCYTCHNIHTTYTPEDLSFTFPDVPEWHVTYGKTVDVDYGNGNLCAHCHQSRPRDPVVDLNDLSAMYSGISTHFGPHYSCQSNVLGGFGAYELAGSMDYGNGTHAHTNIENACTNCHMGFSTANGTGGHNMAIDAPGDLEYMCAGCHSDPETTYTTYYKAVFETVDHDADPPVLNPNSLYAKLGDLLTDYGVYTKEVDSVDGHPDAVHYNINSGLEINGALTAALFNHMYAYEDHSHGIHNPKYVRALLQNSFETVDALD
ncbi:MAG: ammonia-forming cytochrome c nitrite reductase subunit c552 [bacterium]